MTSNHTDEYYFSKISFIGKIFWFTYLINMFQDGDCVSYVFNKYNPLCLLMLPLIAFATILGGGIPGLVDEWKENKFGLVLNDYWKKKIPVFLSRKLFFKKDDNVS